MKPREQIAITHVLPLVGRGSFGVGSAALQLGKYQAREGCCCQVWCVDTAEEVRWATEHYRFAEGQIQRFPTFGHHSLRYAPAMERMATRPDRTPGILHEHVVWTALSRVAVKWRRHRRGPTVISAHGSLSPLAMRVSRWKKRLALTAYERSNLQRAACLHALSEAELNNYRLLGLHNPVAVVPNGIDEEWLAAPADPAAFRLALGIPEDVRILLYVGRITPLKGLPMLMQAFGHLRGKHRNWHVVLVGEDEFGHQAEIVQLLNEQQMEKHVTFAGPMFGQMKRNAFAAAELFVLPSYSEGAPMAVLEALGVGVPVVATTATPWREISTMGFGWRVEPRVDDIGEALDSALAMQADDLRMMGNQGRKFVAERLTWPTVAQQMVDVYSWLLGHGRMPDFVQST